MPHLHLSHSANPPPLFLPTVTRLVVTHSQTPGVRADFMVNCVLCFRFQHGPECHRTGKSESRLFISIGVTHNYVHFFNYSEFIEVTDITSIPAIFLCDIQDWFYLLCSLCLDV